LKIRRDALERRQVTDDLKRFKAFRKNAEEKLKVETDRIARQIRLEAALSKVIQSVSEEPGTVRPIVLGGSIRGTEILDVIKAVEQALKDKSLGDLSEQLGIFRAQFLALQKDAKAPLDTKLVQIAAAFQRIDVADVLRSEEGRRELEKKLKRTLASIAALTLAAAKSEEPLKKQATTTAVIAKSWDQANRAAKRLEATMKRINDIPVRLAGAPSPQPKADGGFISQGADTVPALLSPGEFVVNAGAARQFSSQLVALNGGTSRFADGGTVNNNNNSINGGINIDLGGRTSLSDAEVITLGNRIQKEVVRRRVRSFT